MQLHKILIGLVVLTSTLTIHASQEIKEKLTQSILAHEQATEFHDWDAHPLNPKFIIPELKTENFEELCQALNEMSVDDLNLFYTALEDNLNEGPECFQSYIALVKAQVAPTFKIDPLLDISTHQGFRSLRFQTDDTIEVELENKNGPLYSNAYLPYKHIALTFDDGPHSSLTDTLLKTLDSENVKATFFMLGKNARRHGDVVRRVRRYGHTIANHTHSHKDLRKVSYRTGESEIINGFNGILTAVETMSPFFRFPYGAHTSSLRRYLQSNDVAEFFWSVDTLDWKYKNSRTLLNYALNQTRKNESGIVLFHDIQPQTIAIMPDYIDQLKREGFKFVLLKPKEYLENGN